MRNSHNKEKKYIKKEDNKRKKAKRDNLDGSEKEQLRKYEKEGKKVVRYNVNDEKKDHLKKNRTTKEKKKSVIISMLMKKNK